MKLIISIFTITGLAVSTAFAAGEKTAPAPKPAEEAVAVAEVTETAEAATEATETPKADEAEKAPEAAAVAIELPDVVAVVNGEEITKTELEKALADALKANGMSPTDLPADHKLTVLHGLLDDIIMDRILTKASADTEVAKEDVDAEVEKIKASFGDEFEKRLTEFGKTIDDVRNDITRFMRQKKWVDAQIGIEVTEEDAQKFYEENKARFEHPALARASHILIAVEKDASEEVVKEKLEEAKKALKRVKDGEDFAVVAAEVSACPSKERGGDLDFFPKEGAMVAEFSEAAFALKPGEMTEEPVRTDFGWHIIKTTERKEAGATPFEEVKERLMAMLKGEKQGSAIETLLKELKEKANIENKLPPMPEAQAPQIIEVTESAAADETAKPETEAKQE